MINIVLAGKPVQALIDLGASGCIIDLEMYRQLPNIIIDTSRAIKMEQVTGDHDLQRDLDQPEVGRGMEHTIVCCGARRQSVGNSWSRYLCGELLLFLM